MKLIKGMVHARRGAMNTFDKATYINRNGTKFIHDNSPVNKIWDQSSVWDSEAVAGSKLRIIISFSRSLGICLAQSGLFISFSFIHASDLASRILKLVDHFLDCSLNKSFADWLFIPMESKTELIRHSCKTCSIDFTWFLLCVLKSAQYNRNGQASHEACEHIQIEAWL